MLSDPHPPPLYPQIVNDKICVFFTPPLFIHLVGNSSPPNLWNIIMPKPLELET